MKKLPTSKGFTTFGSHERGFTLVELLVVITIIAVLSVIAITIFGNVQKGARDARRKADIDAISKAMEANYNTASCLGKYCALSAGFFASGQVPLDPINGGTTCGSAGDQPCRYCVKAGSPGLCPAVDLANPTVTSGQPPAGSSYLVCANLETASGTGGQTYECRRNQQ